MTRDSIAHLEVQGRLARDTLCVSACDPIRPPRHSPGHSTVNQGETLHPTLVAANKPEEEHSRTAVIPAFLLHTACSCSSAQHRSGSAFGTCSIKALLRGKKLQGPTAHRQVLQSWGFSTEENFHEFLRCIRTISSPLPSFIWEH